MRNHLLWAGGTVEPDYVGASTDQRDGCRSGRSAGKRAPLRVKRHAGHNRKAACFLRRDYRSARFLYIDHGFNDDKINTAIIERARLFLIDFYGLLKLKTAQRSDKRTRGAYIPAYKRAVSRNRCRYFRELLIDTPCFVL